MLASEIKAGDLLYTLANTTEGKTEWLLTPVSTAVKVEADGPEHFAFVTIHLTHPGNHSAATTLSVTENHAVLVDGGESLREIPAAEVRVGHKMIGAEGESWEVQRIEKVQLPAKYIIQTGTATALASGVLTPTSCFQ